MTSYIASLMCSTAIVTSSTAGSSMVVFRALPTILVCLLDFLVGDRESCDIACVGTLSARCHFWFCGSISESAAHRLSAVLRTCTWGEAERRGSPQVRDAFEASADTREGYRVRQRLQIAARSVDVGQRCFCAGHAHKDEREQSDGYKRVGAMCGWRDGQRRGSRYCDVHAQAVQLLRQLGS